MPAYDASTVRAVARALFVARYTVPSMSQDSSRRLGRDFDALGAKDKRHFVELAEQALERLHEDGFVVTARRKYA